MSWSMASLVGVTVPYCMLSRALSWPAYNSPMFKACRRLPQICSPLSPTVSRFPPTHVSSYDQHHLLIIFQLVCFLV